MSSAEAERGYSLMNLIMSDKRNRLKVSNVSNLMVIVLLGKPLSEWDPEPHVKTWLMKHRSSDDKRVKNKKLMNHTENELSTWEFLD